MSVISIQQMLTLVSLFEYNSNIDKFDICSSVKPAFKTHIFNFKNAHKRNCYEYLLDKVVFIHNGY